MPPKTKDNDKMKQKSLMAFFSKDSSASAGQKSGIKTPARNRPGLKKATSSSSMGSSASVVLTPSSPLDPKTPNITRLDLHVPSSSVPPSSASSRVASSPPTDTVDMIMTSEGEELEQSGLKKTHGKRKVIIDDSDEEDAPIKPIARRRKTSNYRSPSPTEFPQGRAKKPRLSKVPALTDDDETEDRNEEVTTSFSQRLTQFKKAPEKKKARKYRSDDDDFLAPDDEEEDSDVVETRSIKKPKKGKTQGQPKILAPSKNNASRNASSGFFLTAAERREQDMKDDKKAAETPYSFLTDVRDKDGKRPGEEGYDPRTLYVPNAAWKEFTPFEKQFWEIKQNHYDTFVHPKILFFQKGKFFELYEDDARIGHQDFDLKLTTRVKMSMVGVPEMSINFWAAYVFIWFLSVDDSPKFSLQRYKVGRVEQSETALGAEMRMAANKSKGKASEDKGKDKIVRRELNKVYTNGTLVDPELLTDDQAGHCIAIIESASPDNSADGNQFGICVLDCSTSQFNLSAFRDDVCRTQLETLMRQVRAKELVFKKGNLSVSTTRLLKSVLPATCLWTGLRDVEGFTYENTLNELKTLYPADGNETDMEEEGQHGQLPSSVPDSIREIGSSKEAIQALGSMIWYLRQLNIDKDILSMRNFNVYDPMKRGEGLILDGQTLSHIEVLQNNEGTEEGTLLKLLGRCVTPFGKRLFRIWLCIPLREISAINARLDAVQDILNNPTFEAEFEEVAKGLPDLERIVSRIHARNCKVKDFLKVLSAFKKLNRGMNKLADASEGFESKTILGLLRNAPDLLPNIKNVESMYQSPEKDTDELVPQKGKDETYDEIMAEIEGLEKEFNESLKAFEKKLGINLAYWHSAQGNKEIYLIEVPASSSSNMPGDWTISSRTKAKKRYTVGSLQKKVRQLKEARENRSAAIKAFKFRLYSEFDADRAIWLRVIRVFSELDCLVGLAKSSTAIGEPSCRPEFIEGDEAWLDFEELRHPTLCLSTNLRNFIPNDVKLGGDVGKIALLTGPNMAGKSTTVQIMRMTATGVIMAQLGMLVPASRARLCPVDAIITRMGAYDNMFSNASTFKVELDECCKILRNGTPKSLVILDELGRGTSTFDGMAIAGAVLHQLATHTLPLSFFATHYGTLTDDFAYHPNIRNMHMSTMVDDEKKDLVFLFKLVEGVAESSFGTHVANIAGVPLEVVERAELISKNFAQQFKQRLQKKQKEDASSRLPLFAQADFSYLFKLATGQLKLPDDSVRRREVIMRLKQTARHYLKAVA
ncbi:muts domain V-domain-containing protein [Cyathus striatus]|nr:muts domain V-domain-containing protein [Cyathus striatus]